MRVGSGVTEPYPRHWHEEFQLCAVTSGTGHLDSRGKSYFTPSDTLFLVPPGEVHSNRTPGEVGVSFQSIYIKASRLQAASREITGNDNQLPAFGSGLLEDLRTRQSYLELHDALRNSLSRLRVESLLVSFLVELVARHSAVPAALPRLGKESRAAKRVQEYLTDNYARTISLSELAQQNGLSPYHLHRMFSRATGMPPHAYQVQVRIARAKSLLLQNWRIADVASATGFADQSHFTRHFKRLMAVTPGEYIAHRKNVRYPAPAID
jgi:AraC-like DNA-binding protein